MSECHRGPARSHRRASVELTRRFKSSQVSSAHREDMAVTSWFCPLDGDEILHTNGSCPRCGKDKVELLGPVPDQTVNTGLVCFRCGTGNLIWSGFCSNCG